MGRREIPNESPSPDDHCRRGSKKHCSEDNRKDRHGHARVRSDADALLFGQQSGKAKRDDDPPRAPETYAQRRSSEKRRSSEAESGGIGAYACYAKTHCYVRNSVDLGPDICQYLLNLPQKGYMVLLPSVPARRTQCFDLRSVFWRSWLPWPLSPVQLGSGKARVASIFHSM